MRIGEGGLGNMGNASLSWQMVQLELASPEYLYAYRIKSTRCLSRWFIFEACIIYVIRQQLAQHLLKPGASYVTHHQTIREHSDSVAIELEGIDGGLDGCLDGWGCSL